MLNELAQSHRQAANLPETVSAACSRCQWYWEVGNVGGTILTRLGRDNIVRSTQTCAFLKTHCAVEGPHGRQRSGEHIGQGRERGILTLL